MLLNFQLGEDCPCPEDIREQLYEFHDDLLIHCGEWQSFDTNFLALDRSVEKYTSMRVFFLMYYRLQGDFTNRLWCVLQKYGKCMHGFTFHC